MGLPPGNVWVPYGVLDGVTTGGLTTRKCKGGKRRMVNSTVFIVFHQHRTPSNIVGKTLPIFDTLMRIIPTEYIKYPQFNLCFQDT